MTKFKRVLSSSQMLRLWKDADSVYEFGERVEQTILAKLAEQEPVTTVSQETFSSNDTSDIITNNLPVGVKLYAHPCVSQNGRFEKHESQIPDGTLTDEGTKNKPVLTADEKDFERVIGLYIDSIKGWQLVPKEPTIAMRKAFNEAEELWDDGVGDKPDDQYKAMLSAAPKYKG